MCQPWKSCVINANQLRKQSFFSGLSAVGWLKSKNGAVGKNLLEVPHRAQSKSKAPTEILVMSWAPPTHWGHRGIYRDNGKENRNYYLGFRVASLAGSLKALEGIL